MFSTLRTLPASSAGAGEHVDLRGFQKTGERLSKELPHWRRLHALASQYRKVQDDRLMSLPRYSETFRKAGDWGELYGPPLINRLAEVSQLDESEDRKDALTALSLEVLHSGLDHLSRMRDHRHAIDDSQSQLPSARMPRDKNLSIPLNPITLRSHVLEFTAAIDLISKARSDPSGESHSRLDASG